MVCRSFVFCLLTFAQKFTQIIGLSHSSGHLFSKRMISSEVFLYVYSSLHVFDQNSASNKKCRFHSTDHFLICAELFYKLCKKRCKRKIKTLISIRRKCYQVDFRPCSNKIKPAFVTFRLQGQKEKKILAKFYTYFFREEQRFFDLIFLNT